MCSGNPFAASEARNRNIRIETADGFAGLRALLPPPERRGCVLIDPPYEEREDFTRLSSAVTDALQRFESAALVLWLPVKYARRLRRLARQAPREDRSPHDGVAALDAPCDSRAALNGSAMVLVNPPYQVEEASREWLPELRALLGGPQSGCEVLATGSR